MRVEHHEVMTFEIELTETEADTLFWALGGSMTPSIPTVGKSLTPSGADFIIRLREHLAYASERGDGVLWQDDA